MLTLLLCVSGILAGLAAASILMLQQYRVSRGYVVIDESHNGPAQVSATLHAILRFLLRRSVHVRKFLMQYALHFFVRVMYYLDKGFSYLYMRSRDMFVQSAVRNRGTVPHFWNHLKVYKQEMDKEKEGEEE